MQIGLICSLRDPRKAARGCLQLRLNDQGKPELSLMQCDSDIMPKLIVNKFQHYPQVIITQYSKKLPITAYKSKLNAQSHYVDFLLMIICIPQRLELPLVIRTLTVYSPNCPCEGHSASVWVNRSSEQGRQIWVAWLNTEQIEQKL